MEPLSERFLIAADASVLEFIEEADTRPFRFVVNGKRISGLVSISDLQQLPVRAALFAMVTQLEMMMAESIRERFVGEEWLALLSEGRKHKVNEKVAIATRDGNQVDSLLYTEFHDKVDVLCKGAVVKAHLNNARSEFQQIQKLRNSLAHASQFAASRAAAVHVCEVVRSIDRWMLKLGDHKKAWNFAE